MKLSLALLSILQNPTAGSGSGEGSEDFYEIESCFTVYMPKSKLSGISSIGGFCSAVNSGYDSVLSGSSVNKVYAGKSNSILTKFVRFFKAVSTHVLVTVFPMMAQLLVVIHMIATPTLPL